MDDPSLLTSESPRWAYPGGCNQKVHRGTSFRVAHGGRKRCGVPGCTESTRGRNSFCVRHGGGKRCAFPGGCNKNVHGETLFCVVHGGGKRCHALGCTKSARGRTSFCVRHGGGKRCKVDGCGKSAQGSTDFCKAHGGGKRCQWGQAGEQGLPACDRFARGRSGLCAAHAVSLDYMRVHGGQSAGTSAMADKASTFGKSDMSSMSCVDDTSGSSGMTGDGFLLLGQMVEDSSSVGASVVGTTPAVTFNREDIKETMIQMLIDDFCEHDVTTICLIGSSGLGKTTLVYGVYNDPRVSEYFDTRIWVCMSESFNEEWLMKEIIESLTHLSCGLTQLSLLQEVVKEELMGKKFLLILDDAKNENFAFWSDLVTILSIGAKGSLIVVNTSNKAVAESTGTNHFYSLDPLSEETCWSIFQDRVFNGLDPITDLGLVRKCRELVTKCRGNPFYVKALGGLICYAIKENQIWNVLEHVLWDEPEGKVSQVLAICYSFMPAHLKQCFVYFSLFPKRYVFVKLDIVRLWISQGFIENIEGMQPEDTGLRYLDELFQRSFLQHPDFVEAQEDNFVMHELIYEMTQHYSISSKAVFRYEGSFLGLPPTVMHLSIVPSGFQMAQLKDTTKELDNLQSFLVVSKSSVQKNMMIPRLLNLVDFDHLFVNSKNLRTLVLSNTDMEELPSSIGLLEQLHYLGLNNTKIRSLPSVICSIKTLQTLEVKDCNWLDELPHNMKELINLRYLDTRKLSGNNVSMPNGIGQLINLNVLTTFNVGVGSLHCTISELKHLQNLRCLHITGIENAKNENEAKEADLKSKIHLKILELGWCENGNDEDVSISEIVLHNLEPNRNLEELILKNYTGMQFPIWIRDPSFSKLVSITLDNCYNCDEFPDLGEYPSLKCLSVRRMHGIQRLSGCHLGKENVKKFPSLNVLNLCEMYALENLFELRDGDFPCLHTISISNCPMLKAIPRFPFLIELSIKCCVQVPHLSELPSLEYLKIEEFHNIKSLCLSQILPMLKRLEIRRCNKLSSVEGLSQLISLEKLKLFKCPKLHSLNNWQPYRGENVCRPSQGQPMQQQQPMGRCQVDGCGVDLSGAKSYYRRHRVCGDHSKSPRVIVSGIEQRFCQQCSRFHLLSEFDQRKRSCRRRLASHYERPRKPLPGSLLTIHSRHCSPFLHEDESMDDTWNAIVARGGASKKKEELKGKEKEEGWRQGFSNAQKMVSGFVMDLTRPKATIEFGSNEPSPNPTLVQSNTSHFPQTPTITNSSPGQTKP